MLAPVDRPEVAETLALLAAESFTGSLQRVFEAVRSVAGEKSQPGLALVADALERAGHPVSGEDMVALSEVLGEGCVPAELPHHARLLLGAPPAPAADGAEVGAGARGRRLGRRGWSLEPAVELPLTGSWRLRVGSAERGDGGGVIATVALVAGQARVHADRVALASERGRVIFGRAVLSLRGRRLPKRLSALLRSALLELEPVVAARVVELEEAEWSGGPAPVGQVARDYELPPMEPAGARHPYRRGGGSLWWRRERESQGVKQELFIPLANFEAKIVSDLVEDDGVDPRRSFEVEVVQGDRMVRGRVAVASFSGMNWPVELLGAAAIVTAGIGLRDHARAAIQHLSPTPIPTRTVFVHSGWRKIAGRWAYLHGGGALAGAGPVHGVEVSLPPALAAFVLPTPPAGAERAGAIRAVLRILEVAPDQITVPLLGATFRAILGGSDFSVHLTGPTSAGKTVLATLVQAQFGAGFDERHLPANWSSTENDLEDRAFSAKDAVLVIDEFAPAGTRADVDKLHRVANRVLRAQGNLSARGRMRWDHGALRAGPDRPPRGLILSTGEDVPAGQSLRARSVIGEVGPDDVRWDRVTAAQADAAAGTLAQATSAFVVWLAPRLDEVRAELRATVAARRASPSAGHLRSSDAVSQLGGAWDIFLQFAEDSAAITAAEGLDLRRRVAAALAEVLTAQGAHQEAGEPTARFLQLLSAAIAGGEAHVADLEGGRPGDRPEAWGWRGVELPAGSRRVGWTDGADLYLEPDGALAAARMVGERSGGGLVVQPRTLQRRLRQRGLLASTDAQRQRLTVRRELEGRRRAVLHLAACSLGGSDPPAEPSQPSQPAQPGAPPGGSDLELAGGRAGPGDGSCLPDSPTVPRTGPWAGAAQFPTVTGGTVGPVGTVLEA